MLEMLRLKRDHRTPRAPQDPVVQRHPGIPNAFRLCHVPKKQNSLSKPSCRGSNLGRNSLESQDF